MPESTPDDLPTLERLLDATWPGLGAAQARARALGADWRAHSTPFVDRVAGEVVAHVGVLSIPMVLEGRRTSVAGIHAVCCRPDLRRQGRVRALLAEALAFAAERHPTQQLMTSTPAVYASAGFRVVPQHRFQVELPPLASPPLRALDPRRAGDLERLRSLLARRAPISLRLGVVEPGWLFLLDEVLAAGDLARVRYDDEHDVAVVAAPGPGGLEVHDVVFTGEPPRLPALLARLPGRSARAWLRFTPERFGAELCARPAPSLHEDALLVRGPFPPAESGAPFALPPLAYC